ncbi:flavodoxin domain-containing protein [Streptomyces atriruber]|uniref:flavodoxin domain-containing protein n=1 Tax=Streptomyces atriruber TaxID=545121 RepID=UPI0006E13179|nr:flavodoxin domain-containing protein [Streptomyces atriruber]
MTIKVLVAYATKNRSTAEIARTIAAVLRKQGRDAEMRWARDVGEVHACDAVELGSPLHAGQWQISAWALRIGATLLGEPAVDPGGRT